jgi:hypothetical protein
MPFWQKRPIIHPEGRHPSGRAFTPKGSNNKALRRESASARWDTGQPCVIYPEGGCTKPRRKTLSNPVGVKTDAVATNLGCARRLATPGYTVRRLRRAFARDAPIDAYASPRRWPRWLRSVSSLDVGHADANYWRAFNGANCVERPKSTAMPPSTCQIALSANHHKPHPAHRPNEGIIPQKPRCKRRHIRRSALLKSLSRNNIGRRARIHRLREIRRQNLTWPLGGR